MGRFGAPSLIIVPGWRLVMMSFLISPKRRRLALQWKRCLKTGYGMEKEDCKLIPFIVRYLDGRHV